MHGVAQFQVAGIVMQSPEVSTLQNGVTRAKVLVAVDIFSFVDGQSRKNTTWFRFVYFRDQAKKAIERMRKGTRVFVSGPIEQYSMRIGDTDVNFHRFVPDVTRMLVSAKECDAMRAGWNQVGSEEVRPSSVSEEEAPPGPAADSPRQQQETMPEKGESSEPAPAEQDTTEGDEPLPF